MPAPPLASLRSAAFTMTPLTLRGLTCTRCTPAAAPPHLGSPAPWQRRDATVPQFELSVWRKPEEWRQGIKEGSVMRLLMVGAGGLVAGRMRLTASNSTGYMPCLNVPTPPNVVPRTRHLVSNIRTGGVDASGELCRVNGVGCLLVCLCAFVVCGHRWRQAWTSSAQLCTSLRCVRRPHVVAERRQSSTSS